MAELLRIGPHALIDVWEQLSPFIEMLTARSAGKFKVGDVARLMGESKFQTWAALEDGELAAVMLSRLMDFPQVKAFEMLALAGRDRTKWLDLLDDLEGVARAQGCGLMQALARPGLERAMKPFGYEKTHVLMEKKL